MCVCWCEEGFRSKQYWWGSALWCHGDYFNRTRPLGPWCLMASLAQPASQSHALYSPLIKYSSTPSRHNASVHGRVCLMVLLGEWDHHSRLIITAESLRQVRGANTPNTPYFYMNLEGWCLPCYRCHALETYKRSRHDPLKEHSVSLFRVVLNFSIGKLAWGSNAANIWWKYFLWQLCNSAQRPQSRCRLQAKSLPEYKILISNDLIRWYVA